MQASRLRDAIRTMSTVLGRTFVDAVIAPRRFRKVMPEFRRVSDMLIHPGIATLPVSTIPRPENPLHLLGFDCGYGSMPPQDVCALLRVARWIAPKRIFEIGTFQGGTTAHLAANTDAEIFTLDLPREFAPDLQGYIPKEAALLQPKEAIGRLFRNHNKEGRIHQLWGDSRTFDYTPHLHSFDLVLVDACHLYDYVLSDSQNAFELLGEKGAIVWHDFGNALDVTDAVRLLGRDWTIRHIDGTWLALYVRGAAYNEILDAPKTHSNGAGSRGKA